MEIKHETTESYYVTDIDISNILNKKFLVFDLEATGFDITENYITQFAGVPIVNREIVTSEIFSSFVKSPKKISESISKFTGIKNENLNDAPDFKSLIEDIYKKYSDYIWVAQCGIEFDFPLIEKCLKEFNVEGIKINKMDTKILFSLINSENVTYSTDYLSDYYFIDRSKFKRHDALGDAKLVAEILKEILNKYEKKGIKDLLIDELKVLKYVPKKLNL